VEIVCDESGYEGERLIGTTTDVFAHASVRIDMASAAGCMRELRERIRSPAQVYKSGHLLRGKHRAVLAWFLSPAGPVSGRARVFLIEKEYFVLARLAAVLGGDPVGLYQQGPPRTFLEAANDVLRGRPGVLGPPWDERVDEFLANRMTGLSAVDPLIPALAAAVEGWGGGKGWPVSIVHDRQTTLPRPDRLRAIVPGLGPLTLADSRTDPRVQVADVVAGVVRKVAEDELHDEGDPELTALLPPYVDGASIWGDPRSWALITGSQ
jgi:hypothetical protein